MKHKLLFLLAFGLFQTLLLAQNTTTTTTMADKPKISVVGVGTVTVFPNAAQMTIALKFLKPTLREAINDNQKCANEVLAILKKYTDDSSEIKSSLISTDKSMVWDNVQKRDVFKGFVSSQKVIFTLKDLSKMQDLTEELLKTKMNNIERVSYFHTDASEYLKKAQEMAVSDAMETTARLAKAGNITTGNILYIQTNNSPVTAINTTVNSYNFQTFNKGMGGSGVSSSGDLITYTVNVTMLTEIE